MPPCHSEWSEAESNCVAAPKAESRRLCTRDPDALRRPTGSTSGKPYAQDDTCRMKSEIQCFCGPPRTSVPTKHLFRAITFSLNSIHGEKMTSFHGCRGVHCTSAECNRKFKIEKITFSTTLHSALKNRHRLLKTSSQCRLQLRLLHNC